MIELFEDVKSKAASDWKSQHLYSPNTLEEFKNFIISHLLNERNEEKIRQYYSEIDRLFKKTMGDLKELLLKIVEQKISSPMKTAKKGD